MPRRRPWEPIATKKAVVIRDDTELDCPRGEYTAADIYLLASEVLECRQLLGELDAELDGVKVPKTAIAILNRLRRYAGR